MTETKDDFPKLVELAGSPGADSTAFRAELTAVMKGALASAAANGKEVDLWQRDPELRNAEADANKALAAINDPSKLKGDTYKRLLEVARSTEDPVIKRARMTYLINKLIGDVAKTRSDFGGEVGAQLGIPESASLEADGIAEMYEDSPPQLGVGAHQPRGEESLVQLVEIQERLKERLAAAEKVDGNHEEIEKLQKAIKNAGEPPEKWARAVEALGYAMTKKPQNKTQITSTSRPGTPPGIPAGSPTGAPPTVPATSRGTGGVAH